LGSEVKFNYIEETIGFGQDNDIPIGCLI